MLVERLTVMMVVAVILVASCTTPATTQAGEPTESPSISAHDAMPHRLAIPLLVSSFCTLVGEPQQYYVAPYGDDSSYGTKAMPFRTIRKAIDVARAGDTVYVRAGRYHERVWIGKSGTECAPITLAAYPGELPVIDGEYLYPEGDFAYVDPVSGNGFVYSGLVEIAASHIILEGFEIMRSRGPGVSVTDGGKLDAGSGVRIKNCRVHDNRSVGIYALGFDDVVIEDNAVWHSADYAPYRRHASLPWPGAIMAQFSENITVRGNVSHNNYGEGILLSGCQACLVEDNTAYDNMATNLYLNVSSQGTVQRNLVYCTEPDPGSGISLGLDSDMERGEAYMTDNTVINNIVVGCYFNFSFHVYASLVEDPGGRGALINTLIAHNTFVNAQGSGGSGVWQPTSIWIQPYADHDNVRIENNIFLQNSGVIAYVPEDPAFAWSHNTWSSAPPAHAFGPGDIIADPKLTAPDAVLTPGNAQPQWYRILASSPARDAATVIDSVPEDYFGYVRDTSPDIGAHEYGE